MRVLVIDSYDSFTFNLVQALEALGARCDVVLHDRIDARGVADHPARAVVISPGPCSPHEAGVVLEVAAREPERRPVLGVCLGHQALALAFGGTLRRAARPVHGEVSLVRHLGTGLFAGLPSPLSLMRYHSLAVAAESLPGCLDGVAFTDDEDQELMAVAHASLPTFGLQFHPESHASPQGADVLARFLELAARA